MPERAHKIFRILTLNQISPLGLKLFDRHHYTVGNDIAEPDAILVRSHNMLQMDIPPSVKAIGRAGAGTNNVPVKDMNLRGVPVFNAPGANANAVKELVLAGLLMASRNLIPAIRFAEDLQGDNATLHKLAEDGKKQFAGIELPGRTLGIVGLGAVGRLVADAALRLGMKVMGYDPNITVDAAWNLSAEVKRAESIEDLLRNSEFVTLHVPLLDATRDLINHKLVSNMKAGTILLNFSRDGIVDESAVLEGIDSGKIKYYVCDFPSQLLQHRPGGNHAAASGRVDAGSGGELRGNGGEPDNRLSGKRQHHQCGQFPQYNNGTRIPFPPGGSKFQRAQHAGADFHRYGQSRS